jgi:hypothetical protein
MAAPEPPRTQRHRIGLLSYMGRVNDAALRFLVLRMNTIQDSFEFEFVPFNPKDPFLAYLRPGATVDRKEMRGSCAAFRTRQTALFVSYNTGFETKEPPPDHLIVLSTACFTDNHYSMRNGGVSVVALGNWRRSMAPPSILEFVLTLTVREAIASTCRSLSSSVHLGTKGCPCDVTPSLADARQKVLSSYLCSYCRRSLEDDGLAALIPDIETMLSKSWLGAADDPSSAAGLTSALGHDLFIVRGLRPTFLETIRMTLRQEGVKQILSTGGAVAAAILVAVFLLLLGLRP